MGAAPGNDIKLSEDRIRGYKHFANKLWNIARFVLENTKEYDVNAQYTPADQNARNVFELMLKEVTKHIETYRLDLAAEGLYQYIWHTFADLVLEQSKTVFRDGTDGEKASQRKLLKTILEDSLKALHPFMPFATEEIWQTLPGLTGLLMVEGWPKV